jgi:Uma2 family endonuclease
LSTVTTATPPISPLLREAAEGRAFLQPWTVEQYQAAVNNGMLASDPAYELLDGWIVRKDRSAMGGDPMTIGDRHRTAILEIADHADAFKAHGCFLQAQQPVALPPSHVPEPDVSILRGTHRDYVGRPPGPADVICVIEVADASLRRDRTIKLNAYASAEIPLYVIVNLVDDQVELYAPQPAGGYGAPRLLKKGDTLSLPTAQDARVDVSVDRLLA